MEGGMEKRKREDAGCVTTQGAWTVYKPQQGLWTCSCIADDKWIHMIMSPPSGRRQNSWNRDKLQWCTRQNNSMCF